ncbi:killer toxin [Glonium stellatum]|uniref:Killer toxin n=1 Tax=Glonium stellatum TaxID=574774 RepID=A0A8E2FBM2_9PEZI|nr:killer toxin [Glonium stellatum]
MQFKISHLLALAVFSATTIAAEGINCHGSANCDTAPDAPQLIDLVALIDHIDDNRFYNNGEQIACQNEAFFKGAVCAFTQKSGGAPGSSIKTLAQELRDHGCSVCGSIPLFFPQDNNVDDGELTVNWVGNSCCPGSNCICP